MLLMANFGKAFTYLMAAQVQAVGLIFLGYWAGTWLNENHPRDFNWFIVTFTIAVLGVAQTFYVVVKAALIQGGSKKSEGSDS